MTHRCPIKLDQFDVMLGHQTDATSTTIAILTKLARARARATRPRDPTTRIPGRHTLCKKEPPPGAKTGGVLPPPRATRPPGGALLVPYPSWPSRAAAQAGPPFVGSARGGVGLSVARGMDGPVRPRGRGRPARRGGPEVTKKTERPLVIRARPTWLPFHSVARTAAPESARASPRSGFAARPKKK